MKRKHPVKNTKGAGSIWTVAKSEVPAAPASVVVESPISPTVSTQSRSRDHDAMPPPELLLQEAEQEPNYRGLSQYAAVIGTLREKGFSYRDIADWLSERGVEVTHSAVYRVYTNSLSDYEAHLESLREDQEAQEEAERNS